MGRFPKSLLAVVLSLLFVVPSAFSISKEADATLRVVFVGDLLLDRGVRDMIGKHGVDSLFSPSVDSLFASSDYVVANLECPATKVVKRKQSVNPVFPD